MGGGPLARNEEEGEGSRPACQKILVIMLDLSLLAAS